jgi:hypothetical protein
MIVLSSSLRTTGKPWKLVLCTISPDISLNDPAYYTQRTDLLERDTRGRHQDEVFLHHIRDYRQWFKSKVAVGQLTRLDKRVITIFLVFFLEERETVESDHLVRDASSTKPITNTLCDEQDDLHDQMVSYTVIVN